MIRFRPYRNGDSPALADLWNRGLPDRGVVRPLNVHEFDALVMGKIPFDADGLIVADRDGRAVGFAHAGFGPAQPDGPSHRLDRQLGTVAMVVVEPGPEDPEVEAGLVGAAIAHLRDRGARVVYAGGRFPLNPFYWGIYGGSEWSGVLGGHDAFRRAALRAGFEPAGESILMEADLARPEARDPRSAIAKRSVRVEVDEDALPSGWWEALAIGLFRPTHFRAILRDSDAVVARATSWDIASGFGVGDGRSRTGLIGVEVDPAHRRKGFGRLLVAEACRHARDQLAEVVSVQTPETNAPALALYRSLGFEAVDSATLYRLPGP